MRGDSNVQLPLLLLLLLPLSLLSLSPPPPPAEEEEQKTVYSGAIAVTKIQKEYNQLARMQKSKRAFQSEILTAVKTHTWSQIDNSECLVYCSGYKAFT